MAKKSSEEVLGDIFLNLTPLIDILTCLLFFLLLGYRSQSIMLEEAKDIQLPPSSSENGMVITMTLSAGLKEIKLEDSHVMFLDQGRIPPRELSQDKILPLYQRMVRLVELKKHDQTKLIVLFLADRRLKADVITKIKKTCGMAGVPNFHFGVSKP